MGTIPEGPQDGPIKGGAPKQGLASRFGPLVLGVFAFVLAALPLFVKGVDGSRPMVALRGGAIAGFIGAVLAVMALLRAGTNLSARRGAIRNLVICLLAILANGAVFVALLATGF